MTLPASAKIVIVGGGIIGCSTAWHLAKMGQEVLLLEKAKLTSGSTWHAAGLVGQLRAHANITRLLGYSVELYAGLEQETGLATGWKMNGGLRLACNEERWVEVRRQATTARSFGLDMHLLTPQEAQNLWPLMNIDDVIGAAFLPTDGQANPADITLALAKGARGNGAEIFEDAEVTRIVAEGGAVTGVETRAGAIACEKLVLCCGQWTRALAASIGVNVPLASVKHQYMITEPFHVPSNLPTLRDPDRLTYYKEEVGGLVMGGYEPDGIAWGLDGIPDSFAFQLLPADVEHFEQLMELALPRVPALQKVGMKELVNAPESFTPDGNFILGAAPEMRNLFIAAGFNAFGIASGGGAGMALAEWVARGEPHCDLWPVDIRRFGAAHKDADWMRARTLEAYGKHYAMAWPVQEYASARPWRRSPLYDNLREGGAVFGEKFGWERPNWFAEAGEEARDIHTFQRPNWHAAVAREHEAARRAAALFDQTSFAKFLLEGADAEAALGWIAANRTDKPAGGIIYTQMLNDRGGIEADVTCARLAEDAYYITTGTGFATRDFHWIASNIPEGMDARLTDITSRNAVLSLFGPKARDILARCCDDDVSNAGFPFASWRRISVAGCPLMAMRISYVGELGWELHVPVERACGVYEALQRVGAGLGLRNAGYRAIESLRLEKGYRAWGSDIGPDCTPDEAGLGWAVKMKSAVPFKGREAVAAQRAQGVGKMLATFSVAPQVILWGRESIRRNGERCGWLSSAGFGHSVGRSIGLGYVCNAAGVDEEYVLGGEYALEVAGEDVPAEVCLSALYDAGNERIRR